MMAAFIALVFCLGFANSVKAQGVKSVLTDIDKAKMLLSEIEQKKLKREQRLNQLLNLKRQQSPNQPQITATASQDIEAQPDKMKTFVFSGTDLLIFTKGRLKVGAKEAQNIYPAIHAFKNNHSIDQVNIRVDQKLDPLKTKILIDYFRRAFGWQASLTPVKEEQDLKYPIEVELVSYPKKQQASL